MNVDTAMNILVTNGRSTRKDLKIGRIFGNMKNVMPAVIAVVARRMMIG